MKTFISNTTPSPTTQLPVPYFFSMDYKKYQQVLNLSDKMSAKPERDVGSETTTPIKRRTKTGCITCRRRKKKCDEDKVDGKCQACTRNFLECCWAEPKKAAKTPKKAVSIKTPLSPLMVAKTPSPAAVSVATAAQAYPSPILSPKAESKLLVSDINFISLPPISQAFKVTKPRASKPSRKPQDLAKFVITSFDSDKALCLVSSA